MLFNRADAANPAKRVIMQSKYRATELHPRAAVIAQSICLMNLAIRLHTANIAGCRECKTVPQ